MKKITIEFNDKDAARFAKAFRKKDWQAACGLIQNAMFGDCNEELEAKEDEHTLDYPADWTTEGVYKVVKAQEHAAKTLIEVMMYVALENNLPEDIRKPVWEIIRLANAVNADIEEMLEYIGKDGYIPEKDDWSDYWDEWTDRWDDGYDDYLEMKAEEDNDDENHSGMH